MRTRPHSSPRYATAALVLLALLPLLAGLASSISFEGLSALASWWARPSGWRILISSLVFAATGATVGLIAGWTIALLLPPSRPLRRLVLAVCCLPLLVPSSLMGVGWIMALGRDALVTNALRNVFGDAVPTIYHWPLAAAATGLRYFGVAALVLAAAAGGGGAASRAAERAFALSPAARLRLRIGATRSAALLAWLLLMLLLQSDHILPGMFLVHTFGTEVLIHFTALLDPAGAAALALVPAGIAVMVMLGCGALLRRSGARWSHRDDASVTGSAAPAETWLSSSRSLFAALILSVAVATPIVGLVARAQHAGYLRDAWIQGREEVWHSVRLALLGALATLALAVPLAHAWVKAHRRGASSATPLVLLNLAVPGSLLAIGILLLPAPRSLVNSNGALVFAYAARFAAVAVVVLFAGWVRRSPSDDAAARVHRIPPFDRLARLTLPARAPAAITAFALVALLVAAELEMSIILVRPGTTTLGVRLYTMIHTAPDNIVAALALDVLLLVVAAALAFTAAAVVLRRLAWRRIA